MKIIYYKYQIIPSVDFLCSLKLVTCALSTPRDKEPTKQYN